LIGIIWNNFFINPMINSTVVLYRVLFNNYGLAIIVFTLLLRFVTMPLMLRQVKSQRKLTLLQPQINEVSKKYKDPKKRSEETMKLYKEAGANPAGCLLPMLIQFPIWIALYDVIRYVLGSTPESLIDLSNRLYPWSFIQHAVPLNNHFLLWDMGKSDQTFLLPVLVGGSMWLQQKLTMNQGALAAGNQQQQQTNQMLLWMMPLMFGWFTLTVPSGLGLYWLISNIAGVVMNYYVFGWKGTSWKSIFFNSGGPQGGGPRRNPGGGPKGDREPRGGPEPNLGGAPALSIADSSSIDGSRAEKRVANDRNGRGGSKRKDDRGGNRSRPQRARPGSKPGGGGGP
jgi:YidC/Oxa1 family membrane protein insertase